MLTTVAGKAIGVFLTVTVAAGVSYGTFVGLVGAQVNSAGGNSATDADSPTIDYGQ